MDKVQLEKLLKIAEKREEAKKIEREMNAPDFWVNPPAGRHGRKKATQLTQKLSAINQLLERFDRAQEETELAELEKEALFSEEFDECSAILSVHAGAGGTEAQDWAEMLLRMYLRFAERKGFDTKLLEKSVGEEAGIKSASVKIEGLNAYGQLKGEAGVHRLIRLSPYDADKARHTSFALVEVIPELEQLGDIEIPEKDLKIDVFRSSGHGGQSVNTTDSAVRITHLPTKITVAVQNERSQSQNRETALKILKIKLKARQIDEQKARERSLRGEHTSAEWGKQIRSYFLQPYQQVKDHRTGIESTNPLDVLDGALDPFIEGYLKHLHSKS